ncbi:phage tail protein [Edwardsiella ictaluri]|uniref:phage tail protein n=1 Tax=Edwardsiella ictaluri TaxID=67780 RepID=UPI00065D06CA|nr:phage tail protein [Edwardsiella ictaluri]KMQ79321.1 tail component of prophage protein [Edwardsiella ictaluri]KOO55863.1 tail component of prophage protein [Edwardsiella ictaluri]
MAVVKGMDRLEAVLRELSDNAVPAAVRRASKKVAETAISRAAERVSSKEKIPIATVKKRMRLYTPRSGIAAYSKITVYRSAMPVINRGAPQLILGPRGGGRSGWRGSVLTAGGRSYPGSFLVYIPKYRHWQIMHRTAAAIVAKQRLMIDATREDMSGVLTQAFEMEKDNILSEMEGELGKQLVSQLKREMRR